MMSASFNRQPVKAMFTDSLLVTPPSLERLTTLLSDASIDAGWAAKVPQDQLLAEAEQSLGLAWLAIQAYRGAMQ